MSSTKQLLFFEKLTCDDEYKHETPFGSFLVSRIVVANICSFTGRGPEICQMLQVLSKRGRAFIISQKGCPGFLKYFDV